MTATTATSRGSAHTLVLGIGNVLMGDEGVGVSAVRALQRWPLPETVRCLDGGTGSLTLLGPLRSASRVILIDAAVDGSPPGTIRRLKPRFSSDYPRTLTAHDIGLKDLLDTFHLLGEQPEVTLFAVSIDPPSDLSVGLTPRIEAVLPELIGRIQEELGVAPVAASVKSIG